MQETNHSLPLAGHAGIEEILAKPPGLTYDVRTMESRFLDCPDGG